MRDAPPLPHARRQHRFHPQRTFCRTMWLGNPSATKPPSLQPHPRSAIIQKPLRAPFHHLRRLQPASANTPFLLRPSIPTNPTLPFVSLFHHRSTPPQKPPRPVFVLIVVVVLLATSNPLLHPRPSQSKFQRQRRHERCACHGGPRARSRNGHLPGH